MKVRNSRKIIALAVLLALASPVAFGAGKGNAGNPGGIPPQAKPHGLSYAEWSAVWWQRALALPVEGHPLFDETGVNAGAGQQGPVWFLGGVFNVSGQATRNITVPAGKALFFPIINTEASNLEVGTPWYGGTAEEQLAVARYWGDRMVNVACEIDGVAVNNLDQYRVTSAQYLLIVPESNILGVSGPAVGTSVLTAPRRVAKGSGVKKQIPTN